MTLETTRSGSVLSQDVPPTGNDRSRDLLGDARIKTCCSWAEWRSLTKKLEQTWHAMLSLKPPESPTVACDALVDCEKRARDYSDPWRVGCWVNGAWWVKGHEHAEVVKRVVDQFASGTWVAYFGREQTRLIGADTSIVSTTPSPTCMRTG